MAKLTIAELKAAVATMVAANKINGTFTPTVSSISGLLDKIGKIYTIDQIQVDKMAKFDGGFLEYGKTVEEWAGDLILPDVTENLDDIDVVKANYGTFRPVKYSYDLGDRVFRHTVKIKDFRKSVNNAEQLDDLIVGEQRRLNNSAVAYRYAAKRQLLGRLIDAASEAMGDTGATLWAAGTSQSDVGKRFKNSSTGTKWAVLVKPYASTANKTFDQAIEAGYLVQYKTVSTIAKPVDTSTAEAFIKAVKSMVEEASDQSEGNSLSGNTLGATPGMTLFVTRGVMPTVDVDALAGAFHAEKLALPAETIVLPDFGSVTNTKAFAVLVDDRALRLFPTDEDSGMFENDLKSFVTYFKHFDATAHYSGNAFVHVFETA